MAEPKWVDHVLKNGAVIKFRSVPKDDGDKAEAKSDSIPVDGGALDVTANRHGFATLSDLSHVSVRNNQHVTVEVAALEGKIADLDKRLERSISENHVDGARDFVTL